MDNTKKRKIVRRFVVVYLILQILIPVWIYTGNQEKPSSVARERTDVPPIFPDYAGVTIPYNIAPLNFRIDVPAEKCYAKIGDHEYYGTNAIQIDPKEWTRMTREKPWEIDSGRDRHEAGGGMDEVVLLPDLYQ